MKKNVKEKFKIIGIAAIGLVVAIAGIFGIKAIANSTKVDKSTIVEVQQENGIQLKKNKFIQNSDVVIVTAEISPSNAVDKTVNWDLNWSSTNSNNIDDYISLEVSDNTLECTVKVLKPLIEQALLTCTSNLDSSKTANCTIDYVCRKFVDDCETPGLLNRQTAESCTHTCKSYASNIAYYCSLGGLTDGTIDGEIKDLTLTCVKIQNIDVSEYMITNSSNYSVNDMLQYLIDKGVKVSQFGALYLHVEFTYKVYFDYSQYGGNVEQTSVYIADANSSISKTIAIDSTTFQVNSVTLDDSILVF